MTGTIPVRPSGAAIFGQSFGGKIALFELALLFETLFVRSGVRARVGAVPARLLELLPGSDALLLKLLHEIPHRCPNYLMGKPGIPGDRDAERQMLVEPEIARQ